MNRSSVVYRRAWIEEANKEGETVEVITPDGELNMTAAVQKIKRSVFMSISAHGLKENSTLQTEFDRLKDEYDRLASGGLSVVSSVEKRTLCPAGTNLPGV